MYAMWMRTAFSSTDAVTDTDAGVTNCCDRFLTDRVARTRPRTPGEEVGQALVLVKPEVRCCCQLVCVFV
jgi:hypothetical protein